MPEGSDRVRAGQLLFLIRFLLLERATWPELQRSGPPEIRLEQFFCPHQGDEGLKCPAVLVCGVAFCPVKVHVLARFITDSGGHPRHIPRAGQLEQGDFQRLQGIQHVVK
ncbi:hypothetical protein D9M70_524820 [compost metagenome]